MESWTLPQKKGGGVRLSEHGIQNETNYQFLVEVFMFHLSRSMLFEEDLKEKGPTFYLPNSLFQS